jgi:REP element-mobilizing transposase RayT
VCPAKYRRVVFDEKIEKTLTNICKEISLRYEIQFLEIGVDKDHVHFLVQSVPIYSPTKIIRIIKSITAREIFLKHPEVKKKLWGGEFWTDGYYVSTVSKHGDENIITNYIQNQGINEYKTIHKEELKIDGQISLFD